MLKVCEAYCFKYYKNDDLILKNGEYICRQCYKNAYGKHGLLTLSQKAVKTWKKKLNEKL